MGIKPSSLCGAASPGTAASLPSDVVFEVLSRTPVKSLCRFRCACKEWNALISDPSFVAAHRSRAEPLLAVTSYTAGESSLRLVDMDGNVVKVISGVGQLRKFVCSSNPGDVMCITYSSYVAKVNSSYVAKVIDLVTGKVQLGTQLKGIAWGFGRAATGASYKIVSLGSDRSCEVLTVGETGVDGFGVGWRQKQPAPSAVFRYKKTVAINGTLYVLAETQLNAVLRFDLESEVWKKSIEGPPVVNPAQRYVIMTNIGELNGDLCMARSEKWSTDLRLTNVWVLHLAADADIWIRTHVVVLEPSMHGISMPMMPLRVLRDDHGNGKLLFCYLPYRRTPILRLYDPRRGICTAVMDYQTSCGDDNVCSIDLCFLHLERFVSPSCRLVP